MIKPLPGEVDDEGVGEEPDVGLLRLVLAVLLGILLARLLRRALRGGESPRARRRAGLDPRREVRAPWSEVTDERKGGADDR